MKNHRIYIKQESEEKQLLKECSERLGLTQTTLARLLLNKSLMELKALASEIGWQNILFQRHQQFLIPKK